MMIINKLIPKILSLKKNHLLKKQESPLEGQQKLFLKIKKNLKGTAIYQDMNLENIHSYEEYLKIPAREYSSFQSYIERVKSGEKHVLFNDSIKYFGVSSGTSGEYKQIPYNIKMIKIFKKYVSEIFIYMSCERPKENFLFCKRVAYGSIKFNSDSSSIPPVYISGMLALGAPKLLRKNVFPSPKVLATPNWEEKINGLLLEAKNKDIKLISGIPIYISNIFQSVLKNLNIKKLTEIWPNIQMVFYSGTPVKNLKNKLNEMAGKELDYMGGYIATEAPLGIAYKLNSDNFILNIDNILFGFQNIFDISKKILSINEIEIEKEYLLTIGCPNGLLQYEISDVIRITRLKPYIEFQIIGRKDVTINLISERFTDAELCQVIDNVQIKLAIKFSHFFVYPSPGEHSLPCYEFFIISEDSKIADKINEIAHSIDQELIDRSFKYKEYRLDNGTVGLPKVSISDQSVLDKYFKKCNNQGQFKMKKIFESRELFIKFVDEL